MIISGTSSVELAQNIAKRLKVDLIEPEMRIFTDGESKLRMQPSKCKNYVIVQSLYPPIDRHIMQLLMMIYNCKKDYTARVTVLIPYMAYARQDRAFLDGEIVSMLVLANLIEKSGANKIITVDIHNEESLSYFSIDTKNISAIPVLAQYVYEHWPLNNSIVISPDQGGIKRAQKFGELLNRDTMFLKKERDRKSGDIVIDEKLDYKIKGKDVIIVDDIISTGSSIVKACKVLKRHGADNINVVCTHALLLDNALDKINQAGAKVIVSTNSVPSPCSKVDLSQILSDILMYDN